MGSKPGIASHRPNRAAAPAAAVKLRHRILDAARKEFFSKGYTAFTMDDLASSLGMSKKTLYVWFEGKEMIIRAALDEVAWEIRTYADRLLADRTLLFTEKLRRFALALMNRLAQATPEVLADLEESAPTLHQHIRQLRRKNIPYVFGRFIEEGQLAGVVRADVSSTFAGEFFLHAMQGLMKASSLQKGRLRPERVVDQALKIFFCGLLTSSGHEDYEKNFPH